jgi:hypothetical protein
VFANSVLTLTPTQNPDNIFKDIFISKVFNGYFQVSGTSLSDSDTTSLSFFYLGYTPPQH